MVKGELMEHEPERMGGGDPLLLRIVMTLLMPVFWLIDKIKKSWYNSSCEQDEYSFRLING